MANKIDSSFYNELHLFREPEEAQLLHRAEVSCAVPYPKTHLSALW